MLHECTPKPFLRPHPQFSYIEESRRLPLKPYERIGGP